MYDIYNELFHHIPTIVIQTISVGVDQSLLLTWTKYVRYVHQELVTPGGGGGDGSLGDGNSCSLFSPAVHYIAEATGLDF